ncbi:hypothetical protein RHMOL_Rhmol09G0057900 [Rhododendron molle]|uniref:Uncharacterized protein n=1 Tax=Rhododendron molle TaxID=49168 RepID=A0ACC0MBD2_RHOML|nr:hypothetical protein RHMOL_Rhmol09G0057900 [Rhododendron molle]
MGAGHRDEYFNVYNKKRDAFRCYSDCVVAVLQPAICLYDPKVKRLYPMFWLGSKGQCHRKW